MTIVKKYFHGFLVDVVVDNTKSSVDYSGKECALMHVESEKAAKKYIENIAPAMYFDDLHHYRYEDGEELVLHAIYRRKGDSSPICYYLFDKQISEEEYNKKIRLIFEEYDRLETEAAEEYDDNLRVAYGFSHEEWEAIKSA